MLVLEEKGYGNIDINSITSKLMSKGVGLDVNLDLGTSTTKPSTSGYFADPKTFAENYYQKWGGLLFQKQPTFGVNLFGNNNSWLSNFNLVPPQKISQELGIGSLNINTVVGKTPKTSLANVAQQHNGSFLSSLWGGVKDVFGGVLEGVKQSLPNLLQTYIGIKLSKPIIKEQIKLQQLASGAYSNPYYNSPNVPSSNVANDTQGDNVDIVRYRYLNNETSSSNDTTKYLLIGGAALAGIVLLTLLVHRD